MPLYEYACQRCGRFEVIQKFSDSPLMDCPTCESPVTKLLSAPAIQFKGSGWYITDYARSGEPKNNPKNNDSSPAPSDKQTKKPDSTPSTITSKESSASGSSPTK